MKALSVSWKEAEDLSRSLCAQIEKSGFKPDVIIGISRGGLVPARVLSDILDIKELYAIRIAFYKRAGERVENPRILQGLSVDIKGKKVLLVDDISDTGKSFHVGVEHIRAHGAFDVKTAALHINSRTSFIPDYFISKTSSWLVYPWEKNEFERESGKKAGD